MNRASSLLFGALAVASAALPSFAESPKIGVLLKGRSEFWTSVEKGAVAAGEKLGAQVIVKAPQSEMDTAVQIQLLNSLAAQGVQAIVIAPDNKDALTGPVAALAAKGIKVVVIDSPLGKDAGSVFIGTDHRAAGEAAGKLVASLVGDNDEVCVLRHMQNNNATGDRENGAIDQLRAARPNVSVHGDFYYVIDQTSDPARARLFLEKYPHPKAVLASGTPGTMALCDLLAKRTPRGEIKLVGFGFNLNPTVAAALDSGTLHGWIAQLPKEIGAKGVEAALDLITGKPLPPVIHTDFIVITKDNLHTDKVQDLLKL